MDIQAGNFTKGFVIVSNTNSVLYIQQSMMPTFNFELRDFGAALAKEEMRSSDKSRDAEEYLEGGTLEWLVRESGWGVTSEPLQCANSCAFGAVLGVVIICSS